MSSLLLDEMFSPDIATQLVKRGHDVLAVVAEPELMTLPDERILEWATQHGRGLVTENVRDFEILRRAAAAEGRQHAGLVYSSPRQFPRDRRFIGALVLALDRMLLSGRAPRPNEVCWLAWD